MATDLVVSGTAATGLAIASGAITAKCQTGTGTATSNANGTYSLTVAKGKLPCILEVTNPSDSSKLHSVITGNGAAVTANITPLTEMLSARLLGNEPATYYAAFNAATVGTAITHSLVTAAQAAIGVALNGTLDTSGLADFVSTPMVAATTGNLNGGDAQDKLLDSLKAKITNVQLAQVVTALAHNSNVIEVQQTVVGMVVPVTPTIPVVPVVVPSLPVVTTITDAGFEQALIDLHLDDVLDGQVTTSNISQLQTLVIKTNYNIVDLKGIESFVSLKKLQLEHNKLTTVDLSSNTELTWLSLWDNKLSSLDVSKLSKLEVFGIGGNDLATVDISKNIALKQLAFQNDTDGATEYGTTKGLTSLDVSANVNLTGIWIGFNRLISLDVSHNPKLADLWVGRNQLTSLDLSHNPVLNVIVADNNNLSYLNIKGTANNGVPRTVKTDNNANLYNVLVTNVAAIQGWINTINANVNGISSWYLHDAQTTYMQ